MHPSGHRRGPLCLVRMRLGRPDTRLICRKSPWRLRRGFWEMAYAPVPRPLRQRGLRVVRLLRASAQPQARWHLPAIRGQRSMAVPCRAGSMTAGCARHGAKRCGCGEALTLHSLRLTGRHKRKGPYLQHRPSLGQASSRPGSRRATTYHLAMEHGGSLGGSAAGFGQR